jgi:hypothetical protein
MPGPQLAELRIAGVGSAMPAEGRSAAQPYNIWALANVVCSSVRNISDMPYLPTGADHFRVLLT